METRYLSESLAITQTCTLCIPEVSLTLARETACTSSQVDGQGKDGMHRCQAECKIGKPEVYAHRYPGYPSPGKDGDRRCSHQREVAEYSQVSDKGEIEKGNVRKVLKKGHRSSLWR